MKKYEVPEITISMFDAAVATDESVVAKATGDLTKVSGVAEANIMTVTWQSIDAQNN